MNELTIDPNWKEANIRLQKLITEDPLYTTLDLDNDVNKALAGMFGSSIYLSFDRYCVHCKMLTTWEIRPNAIRNRGTGSRYTDEPTKLNLHALSAVCLRKHHTQVFVFYKTDHHVTKIGQLPSSADVSFGELREIDGSLETADRKELGRAIGLFAHDAPLGAFVYLRRIFERMISRAHDRHIEIGNPPIPDFGTLKMDKRIKALSDQLPPKVVQNSNVFQVLSLGIHELSDDDASELFPLLKTVIFQMLGDEERMRQARKQEAETDAAFAAVVERFNKPDGPEV